MSFRKLSLLLVGAGAIWSIPVQAEKLAVEGVYAARTDGAVGVTEISIEPIHGNEGLALERSLADALGTASIYGEPFFRLSYDPTGAVPSSDNRAALRGHAEARIYDLSDGAIEHTRCVRKKVVEDGGDKICVESVTDVYECRRLLVEFRPDVALVANRNTLYDRQDKFAGSERYCADSSLVPSAEAMLEPMIARFARAVRLDLAPEQRFNRYRIFESRKGLKGADRKAFKHAIKLTKSDPAGACFVFEDILARNPSQRSALYNVALCREAEGQLALAAEAYSHLIRISDKSQFRKGLARVESRFAAREQLASIDQNQFAAALPHSRRGLEN